VTEQLPIFFITRRYTHPETANYLGRSKLDLPGFLKQEGLQFSLFHGYARQESPE